MKGDTHMKKSNTAETQNTIIFRPQGSKVAVEVKLTDETVWLTQAQLAELFLTERRVVTKHIRNTLQSNELTKDSVCAFFAHTASDGKTYKG